MDLAGLIIVELGNAIFNGYFWIVLALVAFQYHRIAKGRERLFGIKGSNVLKDTALATAFGLVGGLIGSVLLVLAGIDLMGLGIGYIWPLALFLMFINPRFLCFSYAAGIIAMFSLLFGVLEINIPHLMGLVAVLHLVESLLISFSGHVGAVPMYTKLKTGKIVGGFTLQKFWPLPIVALAFLPDFSGLTTLPKMPGWWPLIKLGSEFSLNPVGVLLPFVAGLGYGDLALAHTPVEKSKMSARNLSIYSMVLLLMALLASRYQLFLYIAALFAPLGHELVIYIGKYTEISGKPIFVPAGRGVRVLEAVPNSAAHKAGIESGDIIFSVNGVEVASKRDIEAVVWGSAGLLEMEFISHAGGNWQRTVARITPHLPMGIIAVPEGYETMYAEIANPVPLSGLWRRIKQWR